MDNNDVRVEKKYRKLRFARDACFRCFDPFYSYSEDNKKITTMTAARK